MAMEMNDGMEMTLQDEYEHLRKRRDELKTIVCNLQDIYDWFDKNEIHLESTIDFRDLPEAIDEIDNTIYDLDDELEDLAEQLNPVSEGDCRDISQ